MLAFLEGWHQEQLETSRAGEAGALATRAFLPLAKLIDDSSVPLTWFAFAFGFVVGHGFAFFRQFGARGFAGFGLVVHGLGSGGGASQFS